MTPNQPFEYFAASAVVLAAFFLFLQVAIYGDAGKGWIDRPWYIRAPMSLAAASLCYKFYAWAWLGEHFTHGGAVTSFCIGLWQFTAVFYAVTQSYKARAEMVTKALFDNHPAWGQTEPSVAIGPHEFGRGFKGLFHGTDRQNAQREASTQRQKDRRSSSS